MVKLTSRMLTVIDEKSCNPITCYKISDNCLIWKDFVDKTKSLLTIQKKQRSYSNSFFNNDFDKETGKLDIVLKDNELFVEITSDNR